MDTFNYAYVAGYIDGDGCFYIRKQKNKFSADIIISSTNKEIFQMFRGQFGGKIYKKSPDVGHKPQYHFYIRGIKGLQMLEKILPYLVEKKEEAIIYLNFVQKKCALEREQLIKTMEIQKHSCNFVSKDMKEKFEADRSTKVPTQEDFAYLAGFIDAECSMGLNRYRNKDKPNFLYKILLQCNNTKAPVFKWLVERFGGQLHFIDRSHMIPFNRNQLTWRLCSSSFQKILATIHPFIKYKKPVCEELMKFCETITPNGSRHSEHRVRYACILNVRERIFHKIQQLNRKGVKII